MKSKPSKAIIEYQFELVRPLISATIFGNLLLVFAFMLTLNIYSPHILFCIGTALLFSIANKHYDWRRSSMNFIWICIYLTIFFLEFLDLGLMHINAIENIHSARIRLMLNFILGVIPITYPMIRLFLVIPLIQVFLKSRNL